MFGLAIDLEPLVSESYLEGSNDLARGSYFGNYRAKDRVPKLDHGKRCVRAQMALPCWKSMDRPFFKSLCLIRKSLLCRTSPLAFPSIHQRLRFDCSRLTREHCLLASPMTTSNARGCLETNCMNHHRPELLSYRPMLNALW